MYRPAHPIKAAYGAHVSLDIAPTDNILFVTAGETGHKRFCQGRWGLVPWRAKAVPRLVAFTARIETVDTSSTYKDAWASRRCLIPANGFYTTGEDGDRDSWFIRREGGRPFSFAGLWAYNKKLGVTSCTIITVPAAQRMRELHKRQPAILCSEAYEAWLNPATPTNDVKRLLDRNLDGELEFHRISQTADAPETRNDVAFDEHGSTDVARPNRRVRYADGDDRLERPAGSPSEQPSEVLIDARDRLLARRSGIFKHWCEHENCSNGAFWGYSQSDQGTRRWYCDEHRLVREAAPVRPRPNRASGHGPVR